ncbi:hypothetical protein RXV94_12405, partial [Yeosuana sp. MJ-SS3]|nr:hypothetical protein [Yeosuana sp. MJ-SS3]
METNTFKFNMKRHAVLLLLVLFGITNLSAQIDLRTCGYNCTANSFSIESVYLSATNVPGTPLTNTSCEPGTLINVYMIAGVSSNRNAPVYGARVFADLMVGDTPVPINEYLGTLPSSNQGITEYLVYGPFDWTCGELLTLENLLVVWKTSLPGSPGPNSPYNCSTYSSSQCQFPSDLIVSTPLAVQYEYTACTTGSTSTVTFQSTTIGGTPPYTYVWNYDGGTYLGGTASSPIVLYDQSSPPYDPTLKVTDVNGNTNLEPYSETLIFPLELTNTPSSTDPSCTTSDGSGSFTASGGTPPYSFNVDSNNTGASTFMNGPPPTQLTFTGAGPGTITVTITDSAGCTDQESITISPGDSEAPTGTAPAGTTGINACAADALPAIPAFDPIAAADGYTDNTSVVTATLTNTSAVSGDNCSWSVTYTFSVSDDCGNTLPGQTITHSGSDQDAATGTTPAGTSGINACADETEIDGIVTTATDVAAIEAAYSDDCGTVTASFVSQTLSGDQCSWSLERT